jgi:hypothetical protein
MKSSKNDSPIWMKTTLQWAGIYNILWGAWVVLLPNSFFEWVGMDLPNYPAIWQSVGMIVGVYGLGYYIAAYNPYQHYPVILVGFLGKLFGPIGFLMYALQGKIAWQFGLINITNDIIWLVPFAIILYKTYLFHTGNK